MIAPHKIGMKTEHQKKANGRKWYAGSYIFGTGSGTHISFQCLLQIAVNYGRSAFYGYAQLRWHLFIFIDLQSSQETQNPPRATSWGFDPPAPR
jgi:hypothetical protein